MSLTRRRLFQRLATPEGSAHAQWIAARGREAGLMEYGEQGMAAGPAPIRIASNENPLGPGQHVLDAIVGKFPEAHRYPFNARQHEGVLIKAIADKFQAKPENVLLGPGSGEILTHSVRAFTSPARPLVTAWPSFENPRDTDAPVQGRRGVGLENVRRRLMAMFGQDARLETRLDPGSFRVELLLPVDADPRPVGTHNDD